MKRALMWISGRSESSDAVPQYSVRSKERYQFEQAAEFVVNLKQIPALCSRLSTPRMKFLNQTTPR